MHKFLIAPVWSQWKTYGEHNAEHVGTVGDNCGILRLSSSHRRVYSPSQDGVTFPPTSLSSPRPYRGILYDQQPRDLGCNEGWATGRRLLGVDQASRRLFPRCFARDDTRCDISESTFFALGTQEWQTDKPPGTHCRLISVTYTVR